MLSGTEHKHVPVSRVDLGQEANLCVVRKIIGSCKETVITMIIVYSGTTLFQAPMVYIKCINIFGGSSKGGVHGIHQVYMQINIFRVYSKGGVHGIHQVYM